MVLPAAQMIARWPVASKVARAIRRHRSTWRADYPPSSCRYFRSLPRGNWQSTPSSAGDRQHRVPSAAKINLCPTRRSAGHCPHGGDSSRFPDEFACSSVSVSLHLSLCVCFYVSVCRRLPVSSYRSVSWSLIVLLWLPVSSARCYHHQQQYKMPALILLYEDTHHCLLSY